MQYKELVEEYDNIRPKYNEYLRLVSVVTGDKYFGPLPDALQLKLEELERCTEDITGNRAKLHVTRDGKFKERDAVQDWDYECKLVTEMIRNRRNVATYEDKCISILRDWISSNTVVISGQLKTDIETLAEELHSEELINERDVFRIWNDGEIDLQKGGELYGQRSVFTMKPAVSVSYARTWRILVCNSPRKRR